MENLRNTRQKKIIIDTIKYDKTHPSISEVYKKVKETDNSIGQATVYRTINKLVEDNKVRKILVDGTYRYDCDYNVHYHLLCKKCHHIYDIYDDEYLKFIRKVENEYLVKIDDATILLEGVCSKCNKNEKI